MPTEDRRLVVVEAAAGLIREGGVVPTTRDIASAAGIAEGTVFRAFATKDELLDAVVGAVACPSPLRCALDAIDLALPLPDRLVAGTDVLLRRFADLFATLAPLGRTGPPVHLPHPGCPEPTASLAPPPTQGHLLRLLLPDADRLRLPVDDVVHALRMLAFAGAHGHLARGHLTTADDIVDLVLLGALDLTAHPDPPPARSPRSPTALEGPTC